MMLVKLCGWDNASGEWKRPVWVNADEVAVVDDTSDLDTKRTALVMRSGHQLVVAGPGWAVLKSLGLVAMAAPERLLDG